MITHYIPIWARTNGDRYLAVCQRYVDYASDSDRPTCEDCRRLIAEEGVDRDRSISQYASSSISR